MYLIALQRQTENACFKEIEFVMAEGEGVSVL